MLLPTIAMLNQSDVDVIGILVYFMGSKSENLFNPALIIMGCLISLDNKQIPDRFILEGGIDKTLNLSFSSDMKTVKHTMWMLGNVAASGVTFCEDLIKN